MEQTCVVFCRWRGFRELCSQKNISKIYAQQQVLNFTLSVETGAPSICRVNRFETVSHLILNAFVVG